MRQFITLTGRNLKLYLRDKGAVFFSLLSMLIVIGLMVFFLGDMSVGSIKDALGAMPGRDAEADAKNAELLVLVWTCAGILAINAVTVTLAVYSVMIKDKMSGKLGSIYTAPISRGVITGSYIAAAWIASVLICGITLALTEGYCVTEGLEAFSFATHMKLLGMIMVNSFAYATFMYIAAMIAGTEGAWSGIGTVIGTLVGFLGGIYLPIGALSETIGNLMKCTPVIYGTAMFREIMMEDILQETFDGIPRSFVDEYELEMGVRLEVFDELLTTGQEVGLLVIFGLVFLVAGVCMLKFGKKKDRY